MKNYTTQTAALKATTVDTRLLDAKRIDTQKLYVNGVSIDELQSGGGSGGVSDEVIEKINNTINLSYKFTRKHLLVCAFQNGALAGCYWDEEEFDGCVFNNGKLSISPPTISVKVNTTTYLCGAEPVAAECYIMDNDYNLEPYIIDYSMNWEDESYVFNLYNEGDSINELYNGSLGDGKEMTFSVTFYYNGPHEFLGWEELPSTYSLREPQQSNFSSIQKAREILEQLKQQNLDNPTE